MSTPYLMSEQTCRRTVRARSGGWCEARIAGVCLGRAESAHHRRKPGRVWTPSNVLDLCGDGGRGCHGWVEANPAAAHDVGLWLRTGEAPAATPFLGVHLGVLSSWLLDDDGGIATAPPA